MSESSGPLPLRVATVTDDLDRAALERMTGGELDALDDLYERYKTMAYSIAYRITNDATLAEDVVQDAFLGVWRNACRSPSRHPGAAGRICRHRRRRAFGDAQSLRPCPCACRACLRGDTASAAA